MPTYHVLMESKATPADEAATITVSYESPEYREAWVGARTVCRMGTMFKDDPRCKSATSAREFWLDGKPFPIGAGVWTVRRIFVAGTKKKGKQRMTTLSAEDVLGVLDDKKMKVSKVLRDMLTTVLNDGGGLRVTTAVARRLGLQIENDQADEDRETVEGAKKSKQA